MQRGFQIIRYDPLQHAQYKTSIIAAYKSDVANTAKTHPWFAVYDSTSEATADDILHDRLSGRLMIGIDHEVVVCGLIYFLGRPGLVQNDNPDCCFIGESIVLPILSIEKQDEYLTLLLEEIVEESQRYGCHRLEWNNFVNLVELGNTFFKFGFQVIQTKKKFERQNIHWHIMEKSI